MKAKDELKKELFEIKNALPFIKPLIRHRMELTDKINML